MQLSFLIYILYELVLFKGLNDEGVFQYYILFFVYVEAISIINPIYGLQEFTPRKFGSSR